MTAALVAGAGAAGGLLAAWPPPRCRLPGLLAAPRPPRGPLRAVPGFRRLRRVLLPLGAAGCAALLGVAPAVAAAAVVLVLLHRRSAAAAATQRSRARAAAATACAAVAADVRAGVDLADALRGAAAVVAPPASWSGERSAVPRPPPVNGPVVDVSLRLSQAGRAAGLGSEPGEVLQGSPVQALAALGSALLVAGASGAPLAAVVDQVAQGARADERARQEAVATLAGARATTGLLAALPLVGLGLGQLAGADPVGVLRDGALGAGLLLAGTALALVGLLLGDLVAARAAPP